jgi:hypothetical protein
MSKITTSAGLQDAIKMLEDKQVMNKRILKERFVETYESFRPVNLIKRTLKKVTSSSFLADKLLGPAIGLAAGYLFRK